MKDNLRKELTKEGASKNEAESLVRLSAQLRQVRPRGLSAQAKRRIYDRLPLDSPKESHPVIRWALAGSLAGAMAIVGLLVLPSVLKPNTAPYDDGVRTLVQPVESELQELEMEVEELQQQETINEVQLQEAEEKYQRTFERYKRQYQHNDQFKNYDWNKWQRNFHDENRDDGSSSDSDAQANGTSATSQNDWRSWNDR